MNYALFMAFVGVGMSLFLRRYIIRHVFTPKRKEAQTYPNSTYENIEVELDIGTMRGWFIKSEGARGCFLLVHGWGSHKSNMLRYVDPLRASGYDVIMMDVLGHGQSDAIQKQVSIKSFVQSIKATIDYVEERTDINSHAIYVLGHSMGGTAASIVNATDERIQALITDSMPTSLKNISQSMAGNITLPYRPFGWLLISWFLIRGGVFIKARKEWRLEKIMKNQQSPALAIHGTQDTKVPISNVDVLLTHSNFKQVIKVKTKGHHNCVKDNDFWENIFRFITDNRP
ncbi:alpha/beta fold hydrolase [Salipaludibacillus agaradhaerens]|uniref:alpha/beta hydrolase n=1 Tax=Salipaludibacillus agaradhaerens TaxID=76935 RepID=UPI002151147D|nr:alpha/beta fold hydrolase [Salipaludibacillus agaradhaerens]MCR6104965.1 alpha/beta fold hydrolase [Salipaludibacillus agaradhaerens]MCR6117010.1 alpha/beta fold hydrolase [Salipaludibacillus agaradhaerens]